MLDWLAVLFGFINFILIVYLRDSVKSLEDTYMKLLKQEYKTGLRDGFEHAHNQLMDLDESKTDKV